MAIDKDRLITEAYSNKIVMRDIIKPTIATLAVKFNDLSCEPIKAKKRGAPIEKYYFTWQAEKQIAGQTNLNDAAEEMTKFKESKKKEKVTK